jgi:hypothetical protein
MTKQTVALTQPTGSQVLGRGFNNLWNPTTSVSPLTFAAATSGFQTFSPSLSASPTVSLVTETAGNIVVLAISTYAAEAVNGISGGGLNTASKTVLITNFTDGDGSNEWMAMAPVTSPGTNTLTFALAGSPSSSIHVIAREFTVTGTGTPAMDTNYANGNASGTTFTCPSLTPQGSGELYIAMLRSNNSNTFSSGGTSGYTYDASAIYGFVWNASCSSSAQVPAVDQASGAVSWIVSAALIN